MKLRRWTVAALPILSACATGGAPGSARALAYGVPAAATVGYLVGDTARVELQAAGQSFALSAAAREGWRMEFTPAGDGLRVTATLVDLDARLTNPMTPPATADESAVTGPVVFTLDRRGKATVERLPQMTAVVSQFLSGTGVANSFFPRLPGRAVARGESWVDTVEYTSDEGGAASTTRTVTTYTVAGDSVVDGETLLLVRSTGTSAQSSAGTIAGTDFDQSVEGTTSGHFLWDLAGGVLHSVAYDSEMSGSMEVAIAPVALAVRVLSKVRVRKTP